MTTPPTVPDAAIAAAATDLYKNTTLQFDEVRRVAELALSAALPHLLPGAPSGTVATVTLKGDVEAERNELRQIIGDVVAYARRMIDDDRIDRDTAIERILVRLDVLDG